MGSLNRTYKIIVLILGLIALGALVDAYKLRKEISQTDKTAAVLGSRDIPYEEQVPPIFPTDKPDENAPIKVCQYDDVLEREIAPIDPNDNIQKNIGYQNNKVGLYIYAEVGEFTDLAAEMVNSNGGEWGYVLIPYNVKDYNETRWGQLFDRLAEKKLIPIVQLWDLDFNEQGKRDEQIKDSARFLNKLKWPIKQRYISVYNETNDKNFWRGTINPEEYAQVLDETIDAFKEQSGDFFMLNGAFNSSARTGNDTLDEETYLIRMNKKIPDIFKKLDGWASHPYPQPNFSGSPKATGRDSIRAYEWELNILNKRFGVKDLPVFITETGWAHKESEADTNGESVAYRLNQYQVADNFKYAFEEVWLKDDRVVAVTPFTIRYNPPHDHFSWVTVNNNPYAQFEAIKNIKKVKGKPQTVTYYRSQVLECNYE